MQTRHQKAFTMVELVFVIVVIGILSAIALPRFGDSAESAYLAKAKATLVTVRVAIKTERQRRILRGDFTKITDLSCTSSDCPASPANVFDHFSADGQTPAAYKEIFQYPKTKCATGQKACWHKESATEYWYRFPDTGEAKFVLNVNNATLDCDNDATDCAKITK